MRDSHHSDAWSARLEGKKSPRTPREWADGRKDFSLSRSNICLYCKRLKETSPRTKACSKRSYHPFPTPPAASALNLRLSRRTNPFSRCPLDDNRRMLLPRTQLLLALAPSIVLASLTARLANWTGTGKQQSFGVRGAGLVHGPL